MSTRPVSSATTTCCAAPTARPWPLPPPAAPEADLLLRPEQLRLAPPGPGGVGGTVRAVRFFGSYYELEVELPAGTLVRARAPHRGLRGGGRG